jgi:23S rRNA pseudouridine955/2504/2580 synthase
MKEKEKLKKKCCVCHTHHSLCYIFSRFFAKKRMQSFELSPLIAGQKVHRYCEKLFPEMSRKEIFALIRHGNVKINKKKCAAEDLLPDTGTLTVWTSRTSQKADTQHETNATSHPVKMIHPKRKTFEVLYEDDDLLVIDKPAGLPVHGGTGTKGRTLIQELRGYLWKE